MLLVTAYLLLIGLLVLWIESPFQVISNPLIIQKDKGEVLEGWLRSFHWGNKNELGQNFSLPRYKFYTEVIEILLGLGRKIGGNYQESLLFLREGLQSDRQFEKKLREAVLGTWLQMGMIMALTWLFIGGALTFVEVKVPTTKLGVIFCWQALGLTLLPVLMKKLRHRYFHEIGKLWKMLYVLRSLCRVPLSRSEVLNLAGVGELEGIKQETLRSLVGKLKETCHKALKFGGSYEEEVKYLMEELRFQEKWHFDLFEKRLAVIKLGLLSLFFLPSYLAFVFLLLSDLMTLM